MILQNDDDQIYDEEEEIITCRRGDMFFSTLTFFACGEGLARRVNKQLNRKTGLTI